MRGLGAVELSRAYHRSAAIAIASGEVWLMRYGCGWILPELRSTGREGASALRDKIEGRRDYRDRQIFTSSPPRRPEHKKTAPSSGSAQRTITFRKSAAFCLVLRPGRIEFMHAGQFSRSSPEAF